MRLYSFFDAKVPEYLAPFDAAHDTAAIRGVIELLSRNPESNRFLRHREDYVLCYMGDMDVSTGCFEAMGPNPIMTLSAIYSTMEANRATNP